MSAIKNHGRVVRDVQGKARKHRSPEGHVTCARNVTLLEFPSCANVENDWRLSLRDQAAQLPRSHCIDLRRSRASVDRKGSPFVPRATPLSTWARASR